ncbi:hypothetical protein G7046_g4032 [Stylonectria norvegica]|nr:hypothetical protein G7046_g4032 [Stylonectria norvegica]
MSPSQTIPDDPPALSLVGEYFFFSARWKSYGIVSNAIGDHCEVSQDHVRGDNESFYCVLGPNNNYFRCIRLHEGDIAAKNDSNLGDYEGLVEFLDEHDVERPKFLSLGTEGRYFIRAEDDAIMFKLPASSGVANNPRGVESVWLGRNDTYVVQRDNGSRVVNLGHLYPGLQHALARRPSTKVLALALNLINGISFVLIWEGGQVQYETRNMVLFNDEAFEKWCKDNFGPDA